MLLRWLPVSVFLYIIVIWYRWLGGDCGSDCKQQRLQEHEIIHHSSNIILNRAPLLHIHVYRNWHNLQLPVHVTLVRFYTNIETPVEYCMSALKAIILIATKNRHKQSKRISNCANLAGIGTKIESTFFFQTYNVRNKRRMNLTWRNDQNTQVT